MKRTLILKSTLLTLALVITSSLFIVQRTETASATLGQCYNKYDGSLELACQIGYTQNDNTGCDELPYAATSGVSEAQATAACEDGENQQPKDIAQYNSKYSGVNPGKNAEVCGLFGGWWNSKTCNVHIDQGDCVKWGGNFVIGLYGSGAPGACAIPEGAKEGEGQTCGDAGIGGGCSQVDKPYCDKYKKANLKKACQKGFYKGNSACEAYKGDEKKACEAGAKSREDNFPEGDEVGASPVGNDYDSSDCSAGLEGRCKLVDLIVTITNVLSGLAATIIVAMIILGGIQYSMAGAEAAKIQAAKQKIINALLALLLLIFGFSIIQWLVPGGLI